MESKAVFFSCLIWYDTVDGSWNRLPATGGALVLSPV